jgi:hypothetical protein
MLASRIDTALVSPGRGIFGPGVSNRYLKCNCPALQEIRGPHDVVNLGRLFGLSSEHSRNGVMRTSEEVVSHGDIRSRTYKGILRPVEGSDHHGPTVDMEL